MDKIKILIEYLSYPENVLYDAGYDLRDYSLSKDTEISYLYLLKKEAIKSSILNFILDFLSHEEFKIFSEYYIEKSVNKSESEMYNIALENIIRRLKRICKRYKECKYLEDIMNSSIMEFHLVNTPIERLSISSYTINILKKAGYLYIQNILDKNINDFLKIPGIGKKKANDIIKALNKYKTKYMNN